MRVLFLVLAVAWIVIGLTSVVWPDRVRRALPTWRPEYERAPWMFSAWTIGVFRATGLVLVLLGFIALLAVFTG